MEIKFNPYARKSHNDYGTYFNPFHHYVELYGAHPDIYEYRLPIKKMTFEKLDKMGAERIFVCESERVVDGKELVSLTEICYRLNDALLFFYRRESLVNRIEYLSGEDDDSDPSEKDLASYACKILYQNPETLGRIKECIERESKQKRHSNVYVLCSSDGMLNLQRFDIKLPQKKINLELNYGSEAKAKFDKVVKCISKNKNGLMLFSGDPGTGKSTFIKYLTTKTTRKVIYLSSGSAEQLTNPDFMSFIMGYRNCILLLEDAEKVLRSRNTQDNEAISNILNITDGILGDCLNILVIATFNTDRENIDSALVRKGRLLVEHHFKALSPDECNRIFESMKSKKRTEVPMTLAEIYNEDDNFHVEEEKRRVGF
ncbi:AAA family ATPase [bacterium]|nr:AAA family ATPase [bacterium]